MPETEQPETAGNVALAIPNVDANLIGAAARGTGEGLNLALNVGAMLISFLALIALTNALLGAVGGVFHIDLSLQRIFGVFFMPLALLMGVSWKDAMAVGDLLGTRTVLNELIAYSKLGEMKGTLDPRSFTIATYALCGFANFSSVGMQIGGIGALAPERRHDLARLGLWALLAGTLANFLDGLHRWPVAMNSGRAFRRWLFSRCAQFTVTGAGCNLRASSPHIVTPTGRFSSSAKASVSAR